MIYRVLFVNQLLVYENFESKFTEHFLAFLMHVCTHKIVVQSTFMYMFLFLNQLLFNETFGIKFTGPFLATSCMRIPIRFLLNFFYISTRMICMLISQVV